MIDALPEASFESEAAIEAAYVEYSKLDTEGRNAVTNFDKLVTLRAEIADLYEDTTKRGDRVDRSKILIGTYCVNYWDDAHVLPHVEGSVRSVKMWRKSDFDKLVKKADEYGIVVESAE